MRAFPGVALLALVSLATMAPAADCPELLAEARQRAERYESSGRFQRAAWVYSEAGLDRDAARVFTAIEAGLSGKAVRSVRKRPRGATRTETFDVEFIDGTRALFKLDRSHGNSAHAEVAAYLLDRLLGANRIPVVVFRKIGELQGSLHFLVPNAVDARAAFDAEIALLDYLMNNADRRSFRNHMEMTVEEAGRVFGIDHGLAFRSDLPGPGASGLRLLRENRPSDRIVSRLRALPDDAFQAALSHWLPESEISALIARKEAFLRMLSG